MIWNTYDELEFIDNIGTYAETLEGCNNISLLKKYINAISGRSNWGKIDVEKVKQYANDTYKRLKGK